MPEEHTICVDNKSAKPIKRSTSSPSAVEPQNQSSKVKAKHLTKKPRLENKDQLSRIQILSSNKKVLEIKEGSLKSQDLNQDSEKTVRIKI